MGWVSFCIVCMGWAGSHTRLGATHPRRTALLTAGSRFYRSIDASPATPSLLDNRFGGPPLVVHHHGNRRYLTRGLTIKEHAGRPPPQAPGRAATVAWPRPTRRNRKAGAPTAAARSDTRYMLVSTSGQELKGAQHTSDGCGLLWLGEPMHGMPPELYLYAS